jgi:hypothetical protein
MLNEGQVTLLWQRLFAERSITPKCLQRAEELIDQLRSESPLRFRFEQELREIRQLQAPEPAKRRPIKRKLSTS